MLSLCYPPPPTAGAMVVGHCVFRVAQPLSAERKLCRASTLSGTYLAPCRGNGPGESQYLHMAYAAVLGSDPQVKNNPATVFFLLFSHDSMRSHSLPCLRERLAPQKAGKTPLDMDQFRMLYCTCKVPGLTKDSIHNYFKTGTTKLQSTLSRRRRRRPTVSASISPFCDRARGSVPLPSGGALSWTDLHLWCPLWRTNTDAPRTAQVAIMQ